MALEKPAIKHKLSALTTTLRYGLDKKLTLKKHLNEVDSDPAFTTEAAFEFPSLDVLQWFNSAPLSFAKDLKGKVVVLDFFTYCCINCMHVLPDLAALEELYPVDAGLVVVGVHSAKFLNEKAGDNIKNAILRYNIAHPVVNDPDTKLWDHLGITCWPTLVVYGPNGQLVYSIIGEGHRDEMMMVVSDAMQHYKETGLLSTSPLPITLLRDQLPLSKLKFPGKVCVDASNKLYVSDSGHHRVLEVELPGGRVSKVIGSGQPGWKDGSPTSACFNSPQGLVVHNGVLYIADTENHRLRKVDLSDYSVTTIAGTGFQGNDTEGGKLGKRQAISSPWDLALGKTPEMDHVNLLYIAMAGTHQIWVHFLEDTKWLKGKEYPAGSTLAFCGSGEELNKNNSYPHKAGFAQPSGLAVADNGFVYVADSESSTVRAVKLDSGAVQGCVGGALDPTDLFAYGDVDGKGREVRLQHPLGVAWDGDRSRLYVADSYNHKIKTVDVAKKTCVSLAGRGNPGCVNGSFKEAQFSEPGGLCLSSRGDTVYVADTNNHRIRILDLSTETVADLPIHFADEAKESDVDQQATSVRPTKRLTKASTTVVEHPPLPRPGRGAVQVVLTLTLPPSCHLTEGAPSTWQIYPEGALVTALCYSGAIQDVKNSIALQLTVDLSEGAPKATALIEALLFYCDSEGSCRMKGLAWRLSFGLAPNSTEDGNIVIQHDLQLE